MPKISVIVPIYNTERYLRRCVDSILNQTFTDFELILVDDGSPDNCGKICDEYADNDERVKVIHKENGGVSSARNTGIDNAKGEYIMFVDSDDYIYEDMLKKHWDRMSENKYDWSIVRDIKKNEVEKTTDKVYTSYELITNYCENYGGYATSWVLVNGPWSKLYRRNIIVDNNIYFPLNLNVGEDVYFNMLYLEQCSYIVIFNEHLYEYCCENENSLDTRFHKDAYRQLKCMHNRIESTAEKMQVDKYAILKFEFGISKKLINEFMKGVGTCSYKDLKEYMIALSRDDILKKNLKSMHRAYYIIGKFLTKRLFFAAYLLCKWLKIRRGDRS